jgi:hypothetical protein
VHLTVHHEGTESSLNLVMHKDPVIRRQ